MNYNNTEGGTTSSLLPRASRRKGYVCMIADDGVRRPLWWRSSPVVSSSRVMHPARNCTTTVQVHKLQGTALWQIPAWQPGSVVITDENCTWKLSPVMAFAPVVSLSQWEERLSYSRLSCFSRRAIIRGERFTLQPPGNLIPVHSQIGLRSEQGLMNRCAMRQSTGWASVVHTSQAHS